MAVDAAQRLEVGPNLYIELVGPEDLVEQDVNAQVMAPAKFERLVENIRRRGAPESAPYCSRPRDEGPRLIVSGHHRVRACRAAGVKRFAILLDTAPMTRSEMVAKQIAHNALSGESDADVLRQMVAMIDDADDLLATGLDESFLPGIDAEPPPLPAAQAAPEWRTVELVFLPAQLRDFAELLDSLPGADVVAVADVESYDAFAKAVAAFSRFRDIRSVGTAVSVLTRMALAAVEDERTVET